MSLNSVLSTLICTLKVMFKHKSYRGTCRYSKLNQRILDILIKLGYVSSYKVEGINIKIVANRNFKFSEIKQVSKRGCPRRFKLKELNEARLFFKDGIISTSRGVMTISEALTKREGGEIMLIYK